MGSLKIPANAEAGFRIESIDAFENRFAINVYGCGTNGWFVASFRHGTENQDTGVQVLGDGEWHAFVRLIENCDFWSLPVDDAHLAEKNVEVEDGEWLTIAGRDRERYHVVRRFIWREPGLDELLSFGQRVSAFFRE
jgi:hypothetical protein